MAIEQVPAWMAELEEEDLSLIHICSYLTRMEPVRTSGNQTLCPIPCAAKRSKRDADRFNSLGKGVNLSRPCYHCTTGSRTNRTTRPEKPKPGERQKPFPRLLTYFPAP